MSPASSVLKNVMFYIEILNYLLMTIIQAAVSKVWWWNTPPFTTESMVLVALQRHCARVITRAVRARLLLIQEQHQVILEESVRGDIPI